MIPPIYLIQYFKFISTDVILLSVLQEEIEEDDGDSIEKVLWHQPKGMAEDAQRNNRSTEPVLLSHLFDSEIDWNEIISVLYIVH